MKTPVKYIMGPLLLGGFIISLCFTIVALYKFKPASSTGLPHKQPITSHALKDNAPAGLTMMLERLITH